MNKKLAALYDVAAARKTLCRNLVIEACQEQLASHIRKKINYNRPRMIAILKLNVPDGVVLDDQDSRYIELCSSIAYNVAKPVFKEYGMVCERCDIICLIYTLPNGIYLHVTLEYDFTLWEQCSRVLSWLFSWWKQ